MLYIIGFLVVITLIVLVHEAGHFFMARLLGIRVDEFAFGMGREVFGYTSKKTKTRYKVCLWPIGGYVKMYGDDDASGTKTDKEKIKKVAPKDKKSMFFFQPTWKKFLVIFAGPAMNYIFAFLIMWAVFFCVGVPKHPPFIGGFEPNAPAMVAGLKEGDLVTAVAGRKVDDFFGVKRGVVLSAGKPIDITVKRGNETVTVKVTPTKADGQDPKIGAFFPMCNPAPIKKLSFGGAVSESFAYARNLTVDTLRFVGQMITGKRNADGLSGPIGIAEASGNALKAGIVGFILFIAHISIGIGLLNLFPIPVLDGGQLIVYLIEGITKKPMSEKAMLFFFRVGWGLLIALMIFAFWLDISRIFQRVFG